VLNAKEITSLKEVISHISEQDQHFLAEFADSVYKHPVLFISHRWEAIDHPDPNGTQLEKLKRLRDCFLIYDYSSFPQKPRTPSEQVDFEDILHNMNKLIENVLVLRSTDYLERGWCVYEYIVSAMKGSIVCDECQHGDFIALRDWVSTSAPIPVNPFHDSMESMQQNHIDQQILQTVNRILPIYAHAKFTDEPDRAIVKSLLVRHLKLALPAKKEHQPYIGEWKIVPWEEAELEAAFSAELKWDPLQSGTTRRFDMDVPSSIEEAVRRQYAIKHETLEEKFKEWRAWGGGLTCPRFLYQS
jgi:hypothetical protein